MLDMTGLNGILIAAASWVLIGCFGLFFLNRTRFIAYVLFPLGAVSGIALSAVALASFSAVTQSYALPFGLPQFQFHLRLDHLSAFFLCTLGVISAAISIFSAGYFRKGEGTPPGVLCFEYHLCLASMLLLLIADDAYAFMIAWEVMSVSATLLVMSNHRLPEVRKAGFLYFLISHIGALALLLCFGLLQANTGDYRFANMRVQHLELFWASAAFLLALFGFGAKAGILPLHIWLPEAHPAAPSPISALMSGFVLKTGVYGLLRVGFDLLANQFSDVSSSHIWWWGGVTLALGLITALFGVVFSAVQTDMKRLLAYSSIENIGLIFVGIGLALIFHAYHLSTFAALALCAALYHVASHAAFKSLLFLGTGSVLHATGNRNLGHLGGLIRNMPWVAWASLIGVLAASGMPPLGGFVSEWLLLQSFLFTPNLPNTFLNMLIPIVAATIALVAALAAYVMVKFFGIIFLGQAREPALLQAHDADYWQRAAFVLLIALSALAGLFPVQFILTLDLVSSSLLGQRIGDAVTANGWFILAPVSADRASYAPVVFVGALLFCVALAYALIHRLFHGRIRRAAPWACGSSDVTARMQDSAEGFGQPIREIFTSFFRIQRKLPGALDEHPVYEVKIDDPFIVYVYQPIANLVESIAQLAGKLQHGRIALYLLYSFLTLLFLLLLVETR
ncbi:MAG: hydrogenase 4 subunit B [Burkholderiales bacterium]|nr:hydrogenase 4 subunit B [Burkholderiales bacterium]